MPSLLNFAMRVRMKTFKFNNCILFDTKRIAWGRGMEKHASCVIYYLHDDEVRSYSWCSFSSSNSYKTLVIDNTRVPRHTTLTYKHPRRSWVQFVSFGFGFVTPCWLGILGYEGKFYSRVPIINGPIAKTHLLTLSFLISKLVLIVVSKCSWWSFSPFEKLRNKSKVLWLWVNICHSTRSSNHKLHGCMTSPGAFEVQNKKTNRSAVWGFLDCRAGILTVFFVVVQVIRYPEKWWATIFYCWNFKCLNLLLEWLHYGFVPCLGGKRATGGGR